MTVYTDNRSTRRSDTSSLWSRSHELLKNLPELYWRRFSISWNLISIPHLSCLETVLLALWPNYNWAFKGYIINYIIILAYLLLANKFMSSILTISLGERFDLNNQNFHVCLHECDQMTQIWNLVYKYSLKVRQQVLIIANKYQKVGKQPFLVNNSS